MGDRTRSDVHPWQLMDLWTVFVEVYTVLGLRHGCGGMARTVVTQPSTAPVSVVVVAEVILVVLLVVLLFLFLLLLLVQGDDFVERKMVQAVMVVQSLGRGLAEKLMGGSVMRGGMTTTELRLLFLWLFGRWLLLVPGS